MSAAYFSLLAPWCDSVIDDSSCPPTIGNNGSQSYIGDNSVLNKRGDVSAIESWDILTLHSGSFGTKSVA